MDESEHVFHDRKSLLLEKGSLLIEHHLRIILAWYPIVPWYPVWFAKSLKPTVPQYMVVRFPSLLDRLTNELVPLHLFSSQLF